MNMPWTDKTGLAKAAAILITSLGISSGLCGLNFIATLSINRVSNTFAAGTGLLIVTAFAELFVMILSAAGLLIVLLLAIIVWFRERFSKAKQQEDAIEDRPS
jgi:hypothetical protein